MLLATEMAHLLLRPALRSGDWVVDATVGNGHDTQWLAHMVGPTGRVFGFDVQAAALAVARHRTQGMAHVSLFYAGHQDMIEHLPTEAKGRLSAVVFNLGYLPGRDKTLTTRTDTTLAALVQAAAYLAVGGHISVVMYPGHPGGDNETAAVRAWAEGLPRMFKAAQYTRLNARAPAPELLIIERNR